MSQKGFWQKGFWRLEGKSGPPTITAALMQQDFWDSLLCVFTLFGTTWAGISGPKFLRKKNTKRSGMFWIFYAVFPNTSRPSNLKQARCCLPVRKNTGQAKLWLRNLQAERKAPRKFTKNYRTPVWVR